MGVKVCAVLWGSVWWALCASWLIPALVLGLGMVSQRIVARGSTTGCRAVSTSPCCPASVLAPPASRSSPGWCLFLQGCAPGVQRVCPAWCTSGW